MQKLIWIENNPIFCKESGTIDIENKPYMKLCFECCRTCNGQYQNCVQKSTPARQTCLKTAYECAGECSKKSSLNIDGDELNRKRKSVNCYGQIAYVPEYV